MAASGRKQPLKSPDIRSGECPVYLESSHSDGSDLDGIERLLLTQSGQQAIITKSSLIHQGFPSQIS